LKRYLGGPNQRGLLLRIVIPAGTAILLFVLVFALALLPSFRSNLLGQKRLAIRSLTESSCQILASYHQRELAGEMPRQQAQAEAANSSARSDTAPQPRTISGSTTFTTA